MSNFAPNDFWEQSDYASSSRVDVPLTDELLASIESELGYKLPTAYVELARIQNGGIPQRTNHLSVSA
ncbi:MAG: SMI1/KNR4 family protein [Planctomycetota bacterium]